MQIEWNPTANWPGWYWKRDEDDKWHGPYWSRRLARKAAEEDA